MNESIDLYMENKNHHQNCPHELDYDNEIIEKNFNLLEKYPIYRIKPIKWNPPSTYFQPKKHIDPPHECVQSYKKLSREVNPDNLSEDQKNLYGKSLYEKDLEIIKQRNLQFEYRNSQKKHRSSSVNSKIRPPDIFYREEAERQQKNEELQRYENQIKKKNKRKIKNQKRRFEKEKIKLDETKAARDYDRKIQFEIYEEEEKKEIKKRLDYLNSLNIQFDRPTRASSLKEETAKKKIQRKAVSDRINQLNRDMKNEILKKETKKISSVIDEINPREKNNEKMKMRKHEMLKTEREWNKWLALTEQTNKTRETMIERLYSQYDM